MDDFGNSIMDFHNNRVSVYYGFAAFMLCAECNLALLLDDDLLRTYGVIAS